MTKITAKFKIYATLSVVFLLAVMFSVVSNTFAVECTDGVTSSGGICDTDTADVHVSVEGGWAISVSSAGTLGLDINPTSSGTLSTITDNLNIYTNIPTGYQLYLNSTSGNTDIYNNDLLNDNGNLSADLPTGTNANHFTATTGTKDNPAALNNNTWGYSLDATPTTFAKVALTNEDTDSNIYTNPTKTSSSGDDISVTYGFMADTKLQPGTYSTSATYTAIADAPTYTITSVSPSTLQQDDQTNKTITIMTSTPSTELSFGEVSAKIGTVDLTDCSEITSDGFRGATCTYSGSLTPGYYNVELTSSWHNATYSKANAFVITSYLTVSGGTGSGWYAPGTSVPISASACATNYRFNNWTTNGGTIANVSAASTTITTTTSNITVTRNCIINPYVTVSGGTGSGYYVPNSTINISASACSNGYTFSNWTTTGGTLGNANASSTTIRIASSNVTVTRNCKVSAVCPNLVTNGTGTVNGYAVKKLADGKCWQTTNLRSGVTWANRGSCPAGFTFPSKSDFDTLSSKYSGTGLYSAWGLSGTTVFWSSTAGTGNLAYAIGVYSYGNITGTNDVSRDANHNVRCYTTK